MSEGAQMEEEQGGAAGSEPGATSAAAGSPASDSGGDGARSDAPPIPRDNPLRRLYDWVCCDSGIVFDRSYDRLSYSVRTESICRWSRVFCQDGSHDNGW